MDEYRVFCFLYVPPCRHLLLKPTDKIAYTSEIIIEYDVQTITSLSVEESVSYYSRMTGISQTVCMKLEIVIP